MVRVREADKCLAKTGSILQTVIFMSWASLHCSSRIAMGTLLTPLCMPNHFSVCIIRDVLEDIGTESYLLDESRKNYNEIPVYTRKNENCQSLPLVWMLMKSQYTLNDSNEVAPLLSDNTTQWPAAEEAFEQPHTRCKIVGIKDIHTVLALRGNSGTECFGLPDLATGIWTWGGGCSVCFCFLAVLCALRLQFFADKPYLWGESRKYSYPITDRISLHMFDLMVVTFIFCQSTLACTDIRNDLSHYPCLEYDAGRFALNMTCSFEWPNNNMCIIMLKNEQFEGSGHSINITGIDNWAGLFQIAESFDGGPSSLTDAPRIHDVHMIGGETSDRGGFIIQSLQKHFVVNRCSSSGVIQGASGFGVGGGGICGHQCSGDILITHCWSSGEIRGFAAGGIAGRRLGMNGNGMRSVTISHCYSTGAVLGHNSGGICGMDAGRNGVVTIKQCYSVGEIGGQNSGGITGGNTATSNGHVIITNSYSRGSITGSSDAGGICGRFTGSSDGIVTLNNVYASGNIEHFAAGGLIGHIPTDIKEININMSVYDGNTGSMVRLNEAEQSTVQEKNSANLTDITGTVYCYDRGNPEAECWDDESIWQAIEGDFPILWNMPNSPASASPMPTSSSSTSPTPMRTSTPTPCVTPTGTANPTQTPTATQRREHLLFAQLPVQRPRPRVVNRC